MMPPLHPLQRILIPIATATALGDMPKLTQAIERALNQQLPISTAKEVMVHLYAYVGFPRSLNALNTLLTVVKERKEQGIIDVEGDSSSTPTINTDSLLIGTANQTTLVGQPVKGELFEFCPAIDHCLKAHLFGDLFQRPQLSWSDRELSTLCALAVIPGVTSQLRSHFQISLHLGLTAPQLQEFIIILREHHGVDCANSAERIFLEIL
ncbi:carboxymuconolactone decarboxylase family protein [Tatumella ptyseos]|uniref:carboxymuconolactone decarboxylase family protein n=1 Tax=Tatumella ptyseos TaxID=82987 RepID=UPI0026EC84E7|nr:carboxymuconolactone decarboxylase family protein [Tatumella ptyseos]WKX25813.1 carboxymuconolactone decarboxylase family protein [Tatumella ptyseos]